MLEITTTATRRPDVLDRTLKSFKENMLHDYPARIIINIDPVGYNCLGVDIVDVCSKYFKEVKYRLADKPNFTEAFLWVWKQVTGNFVFHLEDDWELLDNVDLSVMITCLEINKNLALLRLPAFRSDKHNMKCWNKFLDWNGQYFEVQEADRRRIGFAGHPSLIKREWIQKILPHMTTDKNPEKQLQFPEHNSASMLREILKWRYGVWAFPERPALIKDIGREWIAKHGWQKKGNKAFFMEWERAENE
jgi:hypothetical protein